MNALMKPSPEGQLFYYRNVPRQDIEPYLRDVAERALARAVYELRLPWRPGILWIERCEADDPGAWPWPTPALMGHTDARTAIQFIKVHRNQSLFDLVSTVAHEIRHCWQFLHGHLPMMIADLKNEEQMHRAEVDATEFGNQFSSWFREQIGPIEKEITPRDILLTH